MDLTMDYWNTLVGIALMGTDRQSPSPPKPTDALTTALGQLDWQQPEQAILATAGAMAVYQQVGQQPTTINAAGPVAGSGNESETRKSLDVCPSEDWPCCCDRTARHLSTVLADYPAILPELLRLMAHAQQHPPAPLLPKLLNVGRQRVEIRPQIMTVMGKRGQWLACQNPAWSYGRVAEVAEFDTQSSVWREGSRGERALFLQQWRKIDATAAREALETVWASELAKDREAFISSLTCNLSMADEPFLEQALGDRAQAVRKQAAERLVNLPDSRLCQRMTKRIAPFLTLQSKLLTLTINVVLPKAFEPDWQHDGITPKKVAGLGEKASWLYQMMASIPLSHWPGEPAALALAIQGHKWQKMLLAGWAVAAIRQNNTVWAYALVHQFDLQQIDDRLLTDLLALLTPAQQENILRDKVPSNPEEIIHWLHQIVRCAQTWSLGFSQLVLAQIFKLVRNSDRKDYGLHYLLKEIAIFLHPDLTLAVAENINHLPENSSRFDWIQSTLDEFHTLMVFRADMHQTFNPSG